MTFQDRLDNAHAIVEAVIARIAADSGDRAALRRLLGRTPDSPQARAAHRLLARHVPAAAFGSPRERAVYTVAALLAADPHPAPAAVGEGSLGAALGRAVHRGAMPEASAAARLEALCGQRLNGLHRYLPSLIGQIRGAGQPVGWAQLMVDLTDWEDRRRLIGQRWLQDFYRAAAAGDDLDDPPNTSNTEAAPPSHHTTTTAKAEGAQP